MLKRLTHARRKFDEALKSQLKPDSAALTGVAFACFGTDNIGWKIPI